MTESGHLMHVTNFPLNEFFLGKGDGQVGNLKSKVGVVWCVRIVEEIK